jgi:hypothetical protein
LDLICTRRIFKIDIQPWKKMSEEDIEVQKSIASVPLENHSNWLASSSSHDYGAILAKKDSINEIDISLERENSELEQQRRQQQQEEDAEEELCSESSPWIRKLEENSLPEFFGNVLVPSSANADRTWFQLMKAYVGPGALVAVGYMDPGNYSTDIAGNLCLFSFQLVELILCKYYH